MAKIIGSKTAASQFDALQEEEVGHFLLHVLEKPENLVEHIKKYVDRPIALNELSPRHADLGSYREAGAVILKIGYGYNAEPHEKDTLIDIAGDAMDKFAKAAVPGAFMVDLLPFRENHFVLCESSKLMQDSARLPRLVPRHGLETNSKPMGIRAPRRYRKAVCVRQATNGPGTRRALFPFTAH